MVEATPADQNLLDVELPEGTSDKVMSAPQDLHLVNIYNKHNPIPRNEMTFETGKLVFRTQLLSLFLVGWKKNFIGCQV